LFPPIHTKRIASILQTFQRCCGNDVGVDDVRADSIIPDRLESASALMLIVAGGAVTSRLSGFEAAGAFANFS
jgi:hypothetical protein